MATPRIFSLLCLSLVAFSVSSDGSNAHDELMKYGFPIGLLPANVESYTLNLTSGLFSVRLGETCRVTLPPDNYLATYSHKITGKIVEHRIAELDGISVRAFFKWWGITGIRSNGQDLVFEVGVVTAKYPSRISTSLPSARAAGLLHRADPCG
ncbi:hypothetical protein Pfo_000489 [Paulownia fortunei]|nr:hypothetical protein Pfo_000489 [Paulownia fortunei]